MDIETEIHAESMPEVHVGHRAEIHADVEPKSTRRRAGDPACTRTDIQAEVETRRKPSRVCDRRWQGGTAMVLR